MKQLIANLLDRQNKWIFGTQGTCKTFINCLKIELSQGSAIIIIFYVRMKSGLAKHVNIKRNSMWVADDNLNHQHMLSLVHLLYFLTFNDVNTCMYGPLIRSLTEPIKRITFNYSINIFPIKIWVLKIFLWCWQNAQELN